MGIRAFAPLVVIVLGACGESQSGPPPANHGALLITPPLHTLPVGDSATFRIDLSPRGESVVATCKSSDTSMVTTRRQPMSCDVFAVAPGVVTMTAFLSTGQGVAARVTVVAR